LRPQETSSDITTKTKKRELICLYINNACITKENWRILNTKIYAIVKKPTTTQTIRLHRLCWFGDGQRMETEFPKEYCI
jgi:hypothetical protein